MMESRRRFFFCRQLAAVLRDEQTDFGGPKKKKDFHLKQPCHYLFRKEAALQAQSFHFLHPLSHLQHLFSSFSARPPSPSSQNIP